MGNTYTASEVGSFAFSKLQAAVTGKVMGITSKGVFLVFDKATVFLTESPFHSPFNILLPEGTLTHLILENNEETFFHDQAVIFTRTAHQIDLTQTKIWRPFPAPQITLDHTGQDARLQRLTGQLMTHNPEKGFLCLASNTGQDSSEQASIRKAAIGFSAAYRRNDMEGCLEAAHVLLGRGGGLTPSGDDWLAGFLLFEARSHPSHSFLSHLAAELIFSAYRRTTYISANRLEAASIGASEEIFLTATDWLLNEAYQLPELFAQWLMEFGHSSGVDTWVGIASACASSLTK